MVQQTRFAIAKACEIISVTNHYGHCTLYNAYILLCHCLHTVFSRTPCAVITDPSLRNPALKQHERLYHWCSLGQDILAGEAEYIDSDKRSK